jgi:CHASE1-domain containing sensor protein
MGARGAGSAAHAQERLLGGGWLVLANGDSIGVFIGPIQRCSSVVIGRGPSVSMHKSMNATRLILEFVAVVAAAEVAIMLAMPVIAPGVSGFVEAAVDASLLGVLVAPAMVWRLSAAQRRGRDAVAGSRGPSYGRLGLTVAAAFLVGIGFTAFIVWSETRSIGHEALTRFERLSDRIAGEVQRRVNQPVYGLRGARGVYAASRVVGRGDFAAYVATRDVPTEFPGVLGFGVIERVRRDDLDAFIAGERAVATGEAALTDPITLVQDEQQRIGFLLLLPIYANGIVPSTVGERTANLVGLVFAPVVLDEAISGLRVAAEEGVGFEIYAGESEESPSRLVARFAGGGDAGDGFKSGAGLRPLFTARSVLHVGGRAWTFASWTTPAFEARVDKLTPAMSGLAGLLLSALLASAIWTSGVSRGHALELAAGMTVELKASEAAGCDDYASKPIEKEVLLGACARWIGGRGGVGAGRAAA